MARSIIAGVDEAGRGAVAGPVVSGACILPENCAIPTFIRDSKQLTVDQREEAFRWIHANCAYGVGIVPSSTIDTRGILASTELSMQAAVRDLAQSLQPTYLLVDGRDHFWFDYPHSSVVRGDQKEHCIAAASIVAKVCRDRLMISYADEFPIYGFDAHKGYGTPAHFSLVERFGTSPIHRQSFLRKITATSEKTTQKAEFLQQAMAL